MKELSQAAWDARVKQFGKCCWTCKNTECPLSQVNGQPPHESNEGINCRDWRDPRSR